MMFIIVVSTKEIYKSLIYINESRGKVYATINSWQYVFVKEGEVNSKYRY